MTIQQLFDSFCLEGKITEKHAEEIKALLEAEIRPLKEKARKYDELCK
jgi:hypothetical protein